MVALDAVNAGSLLSMALSAVVRCRLTESFTYTASKACNPFVSATSKATVRTSQRGWCEWDLTSAIAGGSVMRTPIQGGTQCPGL